MINRNTFSVSFFGVAFIALLLLAAPKSHAAMQTFEKEYTYTASELDSKSSCRAIALEQVKRVLLQELGVYVESAFVDKASSDGKSPDEVRREITTLSAGVASTEVVEEKWDGTTYWLKARIMADPDDVAKKIEELRQDKRKVAELEESRKRAEELSQELERMRTELDATKSALAKAAEAKKYNDVTLQLIALDWFSKGFAFYQAGQHKQAVEAYSKAIEMDTGAGFVYAARYAARGFCFAELGDHRRAIDDFGKAIELDPKLALAYAWRGRSYAKFLDDYQRAIDDYDKAIELDPKLEFAYAWRGLAYMMLGDHRRAVKDCSKAIELNPKYASVYYWRGSAYARLGDAQRAIEDLLNAARLGNQEAQNFFKSKGIQW